MSTSGIKLRCVAQL
jgi:ribonuclease HI